MIHSMTAFARCERQTDAGTLIWELRSVNHRYLEVSPRLPDTFRDQEGAVRERCRETLSRGKVDATLRYQPDPQALSVEPDMALVRQLARAVRRVGEELDQAAPVSPAEILGMPGVLVTSEGDVAELGRQVLSLLDEALAQLQASREREGRALAEALAQRLAAVAAETERVRQAIPRIMEARRERMKARVEEAVAQPDTERLEQELVLMAQKMDVAEELDRLDTHVAEVRRVLEAGGGVGRRLDFLMQELNREANTLASKSVDTATTRAAVELKVLIEQMREQVQNME